MVLVFLPSMSSRKRSLAKRQSSCSPSCSSTTSTPHVSAATTLLTTSVTLTSTPRPSSTSSPSPSSSAAAANASTSSSSDTGAIAGGVVGGVILLVSLVLAMLLYLRRRKRQRTAPSSAFMNSIKDGAAPVLRLDSGAEYVPAIPEKGGVHYPPSAPLPFLQNSYYPSPPMQHMRFPDDMMMTDIPSQRPSMDRPLQPQRYSSQHGHDPFISTSVGSRRELWGSDTEIGSVELSPVRQSSPRADSALQFAPRFSLDDPPVLSQSPTSLQPLRRQPD